jgi:hypothetical protein
LKPHKIIRINSYMSEMPDFGPPPFPFGPFYRKRYMLFWWEVGYDDHFHGDFVAEQRFMSKTKATAYLVKLQLEGEEVRWDS